MTRLTSRSDGAGRPLTDLIHDWASADPRIQRVWLRAAPGSPLKVTVHVQPVADSEEAFTTWMGHGERWRRQLDARIGEPLELAWHDPEGAATPAGALVYERNG